MTPYFSVILPIYNVEEYLERCVRSVLDQEFDNYEIILVDDGSTDRCPALCDALARQHSCIRVIHKKNGGLSSARNVGLEAAQGKYVWWVDSDDWIEPQALTRLYQITSGDSPDFVKFNYHRVEQEKTGVYSNAQGGTYAGADIEKLRNQAFCSAGKYVLSAWSHLYRREFLNGHNLQFVSERIIGSEDYLYNLEVLLMAHKACVIPDALYNYELRSGSLTQKYRKDLPAKYTQLFLLLKAYYEQAGVLRQYEGKICRFYVWHLLHGTCISNEYFVTQEHSLQEGRKNICSFLGSQHCRKAIISCDRSGMTIKHQIQLLAMLWRIEPVFYWLWKGK